jgi:hypothetical protein
MIVKVSKEINEEFQKNLNYFSQLFNVKFFNYFCNETIVNKT